MDNFPSETGKIILVVEDDENTRYLLWLILTEAELYSPMLVNDPYQALLVATIRKPDLFLIDYHLPHINGLELYDQLHSREGLEEVPAIIMSAIREQWKQEPQDRHLPFLEKPFTIERLLEIVQQSLDHQEKRPTALPIERKSPTSVSKNDFHQVIAQAETC